MYRLLYLLLASNVIVSHADVTEKVQKHIKEYFESDNFRSLTEKWPAYQNSIENALESLLAQTSSDGTLNVYVQFGRDFHKISEGFLVSDNIVNTLFTDMHMTQVPQLRFPEVSFDLPSNVLQVESLVSKMIVTTKYFVFRNISQVVFTPNEKLETSPFMLQQVQSSGHATIVADGCTYAGMAVTSFVAGTTNLGHNNFKLKNCKFSLEISSPKYNMPPVIVPYFTQEQGIELERLLVKPISHAFVPILQGALFSYVNTTSMFGSILPKVLNQQRTVKHYISEYMTGLAKNLNKIALEQNVASQKWKDVKITSFDKLGKISPRLMTVEVTNITVSGLDSVYSAQLGGAYKINSGIQMAETIRFASLQIRGIGLYRLGSESEKIIFSGEIQDFSTYINIALDHTAPESEKELDTSDARRSNDLQQFEVAGWRNLELFGPEILLRSPYGFLTGVILNNLPNSIIQYLTTYFSDAITAIDSKDIKVQSDGPGIGSGYSASEKELGSDVMVEKAGNSGSEPQEANSGSDAASGSGNSKTDNNDVKSEGSGAKPNSNGKSSDNEINSE